MQEEFKCSNCQHCQDGLVQSFYHVQMSCALEVCELKDYLLKGTNGKKKENQGEDKA